MTNHKQEELNQEINDEVSTEEVVEQEEVDIEVVLKEAEDKYLRSLAENENTRRRYEKMISDTAKYAVADFAKDLLPVADVFQKAIDALPEDIKDESFNSFVVGIKLTHKELDKALNKFGVEKIGEIGEKFDPNWHEALFAQPDASKDENTIIAIIENGYKIQGRLLRSAKVGVVKNS